MIALRKKLGWESKYMLNHVNAKGLSQMKDETSFLNLLYRTTKTLFGAKYTINDFRKMWEIETIQSPEYNKLLNSEKDALHKRLLHSTSIANDYYNKVDG